MDRDDSNDVVILRATPSCMPTGGTRSRRAADDHWDETAPAAGRDYVVYIHRRRRFLSLRTTCVHVLEVRDWWPRGTRRIPKINPFCRVILAVKRFLEQRSRDAQSRMSDSVTHEWLDKSVACMQSPVYNVSFYCSLLLSKTAVNCNVASASVSVHYM